LNFIIRVRFGSPNNKNQLMCLLFGEGRFSIRERGLFEIHFRNHSGIYILFFIHPIKQKIQHVGCLNQPAAPWKPRPRPPNLPNPHRPRHGVQHHVRVDGRASWVSPKLASFQIFLGTFFLEGNHPNTMVLLYCVHHQNWVEASTGHSHSEGGVCSSCASLWNPFSSVMVCTNSTLRTATYSAWSFSWGRSELQSLVLA